MKKFLLLVSALFLVGCCSKCGCGCDCGCDGYCVYGKNAKTIKHMNKS